MRNRPYGREKMGCPDVIWELFGAPKQACGKGRYPGDKWDPRQINPPLRRLWGERRREARVKFDKRTQQTTETDF